MSEEKNWEDSLRSDSVGRLSESHYKDLGKKRKSFPGNASTLRNVESIDFDPKFFFKNTGEEYSGIIADPFKPTLNKWIRKGERKEKKKK